MTNSLRKDFLKELTHLREVSLIGIKKPEQVRQYMTVKFFDFSDGLDNRICDLLNTRLN